MAVKGVVNLSEDQEFLTNIATISRSINMALEELKAKQDAFFGTIEGTQVEGLKVATNTFDKFATIANEKFGKITKTATDNLDDKTAAMQIMQASADEVQGIIDKIQKKFQG